MDRLQKIRELEGQFDIAPQATTILVPSKGVNVYRQNVEFPSREHCPFARVLCYRSDKLYECTSKQDCDSQERFGTSRAYCGKELNK